VHISTKLESHHGRLQFSCIFDFIVRSVVRWFVVQLEACASAHIASVVCDAKTYGVPLTAAICGETPAFIRYHLQKTIDPSFHDGATLLARVLASPDARPYCTGAWGGVRTTKFDDEEKSAIVSEVWSLLSVEPRQTLQSLSTTLAARGWDVSRSTLTRILKEQHLSFKKVSYKHVSRTSARRPLPNGSRVCLSGAQMHDRK
jgi:hypothetical protein